MKWTGSVLFFLALSIVPPALAQEPPGDRPGLSDSELGHLRHFVALAGQDIDDWTGWEAAEQRGMEAYRYQIAFITYALALQQYHALPAWREVYQDTIARLITRMIQKPVWEYWETVSRGMPWHDPDFSGPGEGWRDPLREKNIMYSGHVAHMAALYEMLYRDLRWDEPASLTLRWDENEAFVYDLPKLIRILHDQMAGNPWGGIECEINAVFPECNQHPILAFRLFDHLHGTRFFEARHHFKRLFDSAPMVDPETHEVVAFYRVKQGDVLSSRNPRVGFPRDLILWPLVRLGFRSLDSASACGWTGALMHAWEPALVESHYPAQRKHHVLPDGTNGGVKPNRDATPELSVGYFAALAVEVGDQETADALLAYADAHYGPVWEEGRLRYPRRPEARKDRTHNLTGKLIAVARSNRAYGFWQLHNEPWSDAQFAHPLLEGVDFPTVVVRQAYWDARRERLFVVLEPGGDPVATARFRLTHLEPGRVYTLLRDGDVLAEFRGEPGDVAAGVRVKAPGIVEITTPLESARRFELRAGPGGASLEN
jgi:hypothetical protein